MEQKLQTYYNSRQSWFIAEKEEQTKETEKHLIRDDKKQRLEDFLKKESASCNLIANRSLFPWKSREQAN